MATIGTITAIFNADTGGLVKGVKAAKDGFASIREEIKALTEDTEKLTAAMEAQAKVAQTASEGMSSEAKVTVTTKDTDLKKTEDNIEDLKSAAAKPTEVAVDTKKAESSVSRLGEVFIRTAVGIRDGASSVGKIPAAIEEGRGAIAATTSALGALSTSANRTNSSLDGVGGVVDRGIILYARSDTAIQAVTAAYTSAGSIVQGFGNITRAAAGDIVSGSVAAGSFAAAAAAGITTLAVYSAGMAVVGAATRNLSDESKEAVREMAKIPVGAASVAAALYVQGAAFRFVADATHAAAEASPTFAAAMLNVGKAVGSVGTRLVSLSGPVMAAVGWLNILRNAYTLVAAAAISGKERLTGAEFAKLALNVAISSAMFGAFTGAAGAAIAGTSLLAGAAAGAAAGVASLAVSIPFIAPFAIAAAVATGRFSDELEHISLHVQKIEQMADRFGMATKEMEMLAQSAKNTAVGMGQLAKAQQAFATNSTKIKAGQMNVESVREAKLAYDVLGISMKEIKSSDPSELFALVAEKISDIEDASERTAVAFDLFGRQGAAILPALKEFGEVRVDFQRLGGALNAVNFKRFAELESSFDRIHASADNLKQVLVIPFTLMQKAFNNATADIKGGLVSIFTPIMTALDDFASLLAVPIEMFGRMASVMLRVVGVVMSLFMAFSDASSIAALAIAIGDGFKYLLSYVEYVVSAAEALASAFNTFLRPVTTGFKTMREAVFAFTLTLVSTIVMIKIFGNEAVLAAAKTVASAALIKATWVSSVVTPHIIGAAKIVAKNAWMAGSYAMVGMTWIANSAVIAAGWLIAMGPVGWAILAIVAVGAAFALLYTYGASITGMFYKQAESINAASASSEELAEHSAKVADSKAAVGMAADYRALQKAMGFTPPDIKTVDPKALTKTIDTARDSIGGLVIESARFGEAGTSAAKAATTQFDKLQKKLSQGAITEEEFAEGAAKVAKNLEENLDILKNDSPEITLQKNLELYKSLDDSVKTLGKSVRDVGAGTTVNDKFFPSSDAIKAAAEKYKAAYIEAIEAIKKKQQSGGFAREIKAQKKSNDEDLSSGRIDSATHAKIKAKLDKRSAHDAASEAVEEVNRTLERQKAKVEVDISFASDIRKELETAFLSPVQIMQKELDKVNMNDSLGQPGEKDRARAMIMKKERESLVGKTAGEKSNERMRDLQHGASAGLIGSEKLSEELRKNADELARALGLPVGPALELELAEKELTNGLHTAGLSAENFAKGMKAVRDKFLGELGISKTKSQSDSEAIGKLNAARQDRINGQRQRSEGDDPSGKDRAGISAAERERGRKAIEDGAIGQSAFDKAKESRDQITSGMANGAISSGRGVIALQNNANEKRKAAGLDVSGSDQMTAGKNAIDEAFGTVGMNAVEMAEHLKATGFSVDDYNKAVKKSDEAVLQSLGIEKSAMEKMKEAGDKLNELSKSANGAKISQQELSLATKRLRDDFMAAVGIQKTPQEEFETASENIAKGFDGAGKPLKDVRAGLASGSDRLRLFDRAVKDARDRLNQGLGVDKTPQEIFREKKKKLDDSAKADRAANQAANPNGGEAFNVEENRIAGVNSKGTQKARRERDEALGAGNAPQNVGEMFRNKKKEIDEAFANPRDSMTVAEIEASNEKFRTLDETHRGNKEGATGKDKRAYEKARADLEEQEARPNAQRKKMAMDQLNRSLPGAEQENPLEKFEVAMEQLKASVPQFETVRGVTRETEQFKQNKLNLQAELEEGLKPALDATKADRRGVEASDTRSKSGTDTFFRILRGTDNPSLKAQLDIARNTKVLADAANNPDAAPVIAQLQAK